jgi:hypothetical protein
MGEGTEVCDMFFQSRHTFIGYCRIQYQGGLKLQAWTLAVLPHSLVGHSMTYGVTKILEPIDI